MRTLPFFFLTPASPLTSSILSGAGVHGRHALATVASEIRSSPYGRRSKVLAKTNESRWPFPVCARARRVGDTVGHGRALAAVRGPTFSALVR